jgi:hypothetical protein
MISEAAAPRPNVASGGLAGLLTSLILLLVQVQQGQPVALETWVATLVPLAGAVVAYYFPAYSKTFGALVGAGLGTLLVLVINLLRGEVVDMDLLTSVLSGVIAVLVTAVVPNTKPA